MVPLGLLGGWMVWRRGDGGWWLGQRARSRLTASHASWRVAAKADERLEGDEMGASAAQRKETTVQTRRGD